ncbi:MAG: hypothetical protein HQK94_19185 [Nitrospirae bacterium]|nr:hypothetical protein [Nitrospirota bacterium]
MLLKQLLFGGKPTTAESDYIAILLQSYDFIRSPDVNPEDSVVIRARSYFREFLYQLSVQMLTIGDKLIRDKGLMAKLGLTNKAKLNILDDRFLRLCHILQYGVTVPNLTSSTHNENLCKENFNEHSTEHQAGISLNTKIAVGSVKAPLQVGSSLSSDISSKGKSSSIDKRKASSHSN